MTTKQLSLKKIFNEIPEEYRLYDQDIYPEDSISLMQKQVKGRKVKQYLK